MSETNRLNLEAPGPTIVVIDDVAPILRILDLELSMHGYKVISVPISEQVYDIIEEIMPDVVVMEVFLPQIRGLELLRGIRARSDIPVIFLTTSSNEADREEALGHGASDYILKPFEPSELTHRISSVIKAQPPLSRVLRSGELRIDFSRRQAFRAEKKISPSSSEWAILFALGRGAQEYVPSERILLQVWGLEGTLNRENLVEWIAKLRTKLGDDGNDPRIIRGNLEEGFMLDMAPEKVE